MPSYELAKSQFEDVRTAQHRVSRIPGSGQEKYATLPGLRIDSRIRTLVSGVCARGKGNAPFLSYLAFSSWHAGEIFAVDSTWTSPFLVIFV